MNNKDIDDVGEALRSCTSLRVLYLYENHLTKIPDMSMSPNLTHLYLQQNDITRIHNLDALFNLEKLYLSGNKISVLEGLESQNKLSELRIDHQRAPAGDGIIFDDRSLMGIKNSLRYLDLSASGVNNLQGLECLQYLERLDVGFNQLSEESEVLTFLSKMSRLSELNISENPIMKNTKINDKIIVATKALECLNGKQIRSSNRRFIESWSAHRTKSAKTQSKPKISMDQV
ncbi:Protein phosphatase 1 regulatory subunit 42 [Echinococcus granulosus]|nr:Protein phosphatase 1 regulatory subunit 42 [Echinococcus granulosus]